ncbi:MAG: hypothetical protein ACNA7J_09320, partial [Wenzhouxiangella sp.]
LLLGLAACASSPGEFRDDARPSAAPSVLDGSYDPVWWQWARQRDGGYMLAHTRLENCYVAVDWPMHAFGGEPTSRQHATRRVGGTKYPVTERALDESLREVHYQRDHNPAQFSIFGNDECHKSAHMILVNLEAVSGADR